MNGKTVLIMLLVVAAAAVFMLLKPYGNAPTVPPVQPKATEEELEGYIAGSNAFAMEIYQVLASSGNNLFFSPYSISCCLSMVYCGARGKTYAEMKQALHFPLSTSVVSSAVAILTKELLQGKALRMANSLWIQENHPLSPSFVRLMEDGYGAPPHTVDFAASPTSAREKINAWAKKETDAKITKLIPSDGVDSTTSVALANAIYFRDTWEYRFQPLPESRNFHLLDGTTTKVPMMHVAASLEYMQGETYQAVVLPYVERLSMLLLVPDEGAFQTLQASLSEEKLSSILTALEKQTVRLTMPEFEYETGFRLREALERLGMKEAFSSSADFSGISEKPLQIGDVFHKAFVHVDEQGTEAAAATGTSMMGRGLVRNVSITVDRPFIFLIRDEASGVILFVGQVVSPQVGE